MFQLQDPSESLPPRQAVGSPGFLHKAPWTMVGSWSFPAQPFWWEIGGSQKEELRDCHWPKALWL